MNTSEKNLGLSFLERKNYIKTRLRESSPKNKIPIFSGSPMEDYVPVFMVDINFPIYRLSNIRTKSAQESYIAKHEIEKDFFKRDPECREALKIQHELLYEISISGGDEKNHYKTFENGSFDKAHPMMMTDDGVLINGNTRMSALRELYYSNPDKFSKYEKIPIAILPANLTPKDIRKLELNLQINPDIHKDYPWISEAIDCRDQIFAQRKLRDIEEEYKRRPNEVNHPNELINQLTIADTFLKMYNRTAEYDLLEKDQYALWGWHKWRNEYTNDINKFKLIDQICYAVIKSKIEGYREGQQGDIYKLFGKFNRTTKEHPETWTSFLNQYAIDNKLEQTDSEIPAASITTPKSSYDFLEENLDVVETSEINVSKKDESLIIEAIEYNTIEGDRDKSISLVDTILNVVGAVEESVKRNKSKKIINELVIQCYNNVGDCIKRLTEDGKDFENLDETIVEIEKTIIRLTELKEKIKNTLN